MYPRGCRFPGVRTVRTTDAWDEGKLCVNYWIHIARSIDRVTLHRDRCSEVPSHATSSDFWEGGWFDYPDKERALRAMEQAGANEQRRCPLCKP